MKRKFVFWILITFCNVTIFIQNDFVEKIKKGRESINTDSHLYEDTIEQLLRQDYLVWVETIKKLKSDTELKYRKEGGVLQQIVDKKIYLNVAIKNLINVNDKNVRDKSEKKIKGYKNELLQLILYAKKRNLQMLFGICKGLRDEKEPLHIFEQVLYEIRNEIRSGRSIGDKFLAQIILLLIDRYYLVDKVRWVKQFISYDDVEIKKNALDIIARFSYKDAVEEVTICLLDTSPEVRSHALEILGDLYAVEKKFFVLKKLEDKNPLVRISAIRAARKLGLTDEKSLTEIVKYIRDENIYVVLEVLYTIRYLNLTKYADEVFDIIKNLEIPDSKTNSEKFRVVSTLINEGVITLTYLGYKKKEFKKFLYQKIIPSNEPELIKVALKSIGYLKIRSKDIVKDVLQILNNPAHDSQLRGTSLYALGYLKEKDVIREYITNRLGVMEYSELESIYEIAKNAYSHRLAEDLYKEYKKKNITDEEKLYTKKVQILQILMQFTFSNKVKDILIRIASEENDVRLVNLVMEGLRLFSLKRQDYDKLYKIYEKIEENGLQDREGFLPICQENVSRLVSKVPKYFNLIFKDYEDLPAISQKKITFLEALESNHNYLNDVSKRRIINLLYNSKNPDNGYDQPSQVYRTACSIINLGIDKIIDDNMKVELKKLISKFEDDSKYYDAVYATKLLLLLSGDESYIDIMSDIQNVKYFCNISEYLNLLTNKNFLDDFRKIKFRKQVINGPAYLVFNTINKILEQKSQYTINYLNLPYDVLNRYIFIKVQKRENLFDLLVRITKDALYGLTYVIYNNTIVIYNQDQSTNHWLLWYYKEKAKSN